MSGLFFGCSSLSFIPDISKWNTKNVKSINQMFPRCLSLSFLPDISKWNVNNVLFDMSVESINCLNSF